MVIVTKKEKNTHAPQIDYAPQRAGHASLPGPTTPLVTELLQLPVPGNGTVYRHI